MDLPNASHNEGTPSTDQASPTRSKRIAKAAGIMTAGGAAIAFLVAASMGPGATHGLSHTLALSSSAAAAEAVSQPAAAEMPSFAKLVEKVKPAVVSIYVRSEEKTPYVVGASRKWRLFDAAKRQRAVSVFLWAIQRSAIQWSEYATDATDRARTGFRLLHYRRRLYRDQ